MRILQLTLKPPFPPVDGGALAMAQICQGLLAAQQQVKLLTLHTPKHPFRADAMAQELIQQTDLEAVFADTRLKPHRAFFNLFSERSYQLERFEVAAMHQKLKAVLQQERFDIVHIESLFMLPYIATVRQYSTAKVVWRPHNVEHHLGKAQASQESGLKRWYWKLLSQRLKRYELAQLNACDGIACITEKDRQYFITAGAKVPTLHLPFGMAFPPIQPTVTPGKDLVFLGALDWHPNVDGLQWMVKEVWPLIRRSYPEMRFRIAGRNPGNSIAALQGQGVEIIGEVPNVADFLQSGAVVVAPVRAGSGVRIKVLETLALGLPLVTSSKGIEGTDLRADDHLKVADQPADFSSAIQQLMEKPEIGVQMGKNARKFMTHHHELGRVTDQLVQFYQDLLDE